MPSVCILTDSTVQFPALLFPGHELVSVIPLHIKLGSQIFTDGKNLRITHLPPSARGSDAPIALPPTVEEFQLFFNALSQKYSEIVVILVSSHLSPTLARAQEAVHSKRGPAPIHLIDSQTTAVGMGLLVQVAARYAQSGASGTEISRVVRGLLPHVYTVFCVQSLSYLYRSNQLDPAQAVVGEMLGITPFFVLENGRMVPVQKIRSPRHLVDLLHEFISEFGDLSHISLVQGYPPFEQEARNLRDRLNGDFPSAAFSEHTFGAALASILGPRTLGLVAMETYSDLNM